MLLERGECAWRSWTLGGQPPVSAKVHEASVLRLTCLGPLSTSHLDLQKAFHLPDSKWESSEDMDIKLISGQHQNPNLNLSDPKPYFLPSSCCLRL